MRPMGVMRLMSDRERGAIGGMGRMNRAAYEIFHRFLGRSVMRGMMTSSSEMPPCWNVSL